MILHPWQGFTSALALLGPDLDKWQGEARLQLLRCAGFSFLASLVISIPPACCGW